ncbi:L,D-transpeptidase family protein [Sulfurimonas aquatica]|uniref:L,D-transpeptidase family protein n=1 Tax=Sulfurimonas aquatica TaxID=2672570 RepID=A0A975AYQ3_9BACT|nr:L,D-transpeptidase family protein [Sulfurimonas aquatica]QSZ41021.1 L,D-transpeptidase family protein [Sulfurimonas aquatica]
MIKSILITVSLTISLYSSQQIVLVVSNDFNSSKAKLECFENNKTMFPIIDVNIGKNGLGWGIGKESLHKVNNEPIKMEGDKKAPAGIFKLTDIFGYSHGSNYSLPYLFTSKNLICVDDSDSPFYNQIVEMQGDEKSFEYMKRSDAQYELGVVVAHNNQAIPKHGSCIFLHVQKGDNEGTAGCTSMKLKDLKKITHWLKKEKNPILIQIPKSSREEILQVYPQLKNSELLKREL